MTDYFLKPAQGLITRVEVGRESYCAVYPEAGSEVLYTVCLVPDADAETCPLIAHNVSDCCVCGSPECLGLGVNTSTGPTPADANWPGVPACIVQSQSAVALDCFVQRLLTEVPSLRQFTGSISYLSAPTGEVDQWLVATGIIASVMAFCICVNCVLAVWLCCKKRNVQNASRMYCEGQSGAGDGKELTGGELCLHVCVHTVTFLKPSLPYSTLVPLYTLSLLALVPANTEDVLTKSVELVVVNRLVQKMAREWEGIGIELKQDDLVSNLRQSNSNAASKCTQVIEAAIASGDLPNYRVLLDALRRYRLTQVATKLKNAVVEHEREKEQRQHAADRRRESLTQRGSTERDRLLS